VTYYWFDLVTPKSDRFVLLPRRPLVSVCITSVHSLSRYRVRSLVTDERISHPASNTLAEISEAVARTQPLILIRMSIGTNLDDLE